jgi:hypothetical protein
MLLTCPGFAEIITKARIYMKGPPKVLNKDSQYKAVRGEGAQLACESFAIPPPSKVPYVFSIGFCLKGQPQEIDA